MDDLAMAIFLLNRVFSKRETDSADKMPIAALWSVLPMLKRVVIRSSPGAKPEIFAREGLSCFAAWVLVFQPGR